MQKRTYTYLFAGYEATITSSFTGRLGTVVKPALRITKTAGKGPFEWSDIHFSHNETVKDCRKVLCLSMRIKLKNLEHYRLKKKDR